MACESSVSRICRLDAAVGRERACSESGCSFWEPGGAVVEGRCALHEVDLAGRSVLVSELLRLRDALDGAASAARDEGTWHEYHRLLNESAEE